jgi:phosphodiesterase/alkaline phosphatase D-like protein
MNLPLRIVTICGATVNLLTAALPAQVLTHGPVVGGVTSTEAKVFVRTDTAATVALRYGTDPGLVGAIDTAGFLTAEGSDFTSIIPLAELVPETTYYLNVLVSGVPQFTDPLPFFATFPPAGAARDFQFVVLADFGVVSKLTGEVQTFASAAANLPAFGFIGGDFDHSNPQTLATKRQMLKDL